MSKSLFRPIIYIAVTIGLVGAAYDAYRISTLDQQGVEHEKETTTQGGLR